MLLLLRLCVAPLPKILSASRTFQIITFYWESFKNVGININALDVHFFSDVILVIRYIPTKWNHIHTYTEKFSSHKVDKDTFWNPLWISCCLKDFWYSSWKANKKTHDDKVIGWKIKMSLEVKKISGPDILLGEIILAVLD